MKSKIVSLAFLMTPIFLFGQKSFIPALNNYMKAAVSANDFSGNVLVAQHGKIIFQNSYGIANRDWNIANNLDTKFRIGSLTKQFTAAAVLLLVDEGKLDLNDKLSQFYPDFPRGDSVTIHMLLNHSSGIKDFVSLRSFNNIKGFEYPADSIIALFKNQPYDFSPGKGWSYNNAGYFLLGTIIEKLSGKKYETFLIDHFFNHTQLRNTGVEHTNQVLANRATSYVKVKNGWKVAPYESMEFAYASGHLYSTVEDMFKWSMALFNAKIVSRSMLDKMTSSYHTKYGYGLNADSLQSYRRFQHAGGNTAFLSYSAYFPDKKIYVVVLSNNRSNVFSVANALASVVLGIPYTLPEKMKPEKINPALFSRLAGRYTGGNMIFHFVLKDEQLFLVRPNRPDVELVPESNSFFFGNGANIQFKFIANEAGSIDKLEFYNQYQKTEFKKVDN